MSTSTMDSIKKEIVLKAPHSRLWSAISNAREFGEWFHLDMSGVKFETGKTIHPKLKESGYEHIPFEMTIDRIVPEQLFSFRWHPYAINPQVDYSGEPMTLIKFTLEEVEGDTRVTITESGFTDIPVARREEAFHKNSGGWEIQLHNIEDYLSRPIS